MSENAKSFFPEFLAVGFLNSQPAKTAFGDESSIKGIAEEMVQAYDVVLVYSLTSKVELAPDPVLWTDFTSQES